MEGEYVYTHIHVMHVPSIYGHHGCDVGVDLCVGVCVRVCVCVCVCVRVYDVGGFESGFVVLGLAARRVGATMRTMMKALIKYGKRTKLRNDEQ